MKYWSMVVAVLYVVILCVLWAPLIALCLHTKSFWQHLFSFDYYQGIHFWGILAILFLAQVALLSVPVQASRGRPVTKRSVIPLVVASSFMLVLLAFGAFISLYEGFNVDAANQWLLLFSGACLWGAWALMFYRWSKEMEPLGLVERICRWLFKGSVLELLIAVPSHIYVRQRNECCAGLLTFTGIAVGISVMLFSFGPGVYFLFRERFEKLNSKARPK